MLLCWWGGFRMISALRGPAPGVSTGEARIYPGADAWNADVADRASRRGRRVVPDVPIEIVERPGRGLSHVRDCWNCAAARGPAG